MIENHQLDDFLKEVSYLLEDKFQIILEYNQIGDDYCAYDYFSDKRPPIEAATAIAATFTPEED